MATSSERQSPNLEAQVAAGTITGHLAHLQAREGSGLSPLNSPRQVSGTDPSAALRKLFEHYGEATVREALEALQQR